MNLVDQIFEQARAGSAQGQGFGQFFAEGIQQGQAQQRIDAEKQRLAMEIAQMPLKQTLLQQNTQMNALKLEQGLRARQDELEADKAFTGLAGQVSPLLSTGKIDEAQNVILAAGSSNAFLLNDPRFKNLYDFTTKAQDAKLELAKARHPAFAPEILEVPNPIPGFPATQVLRTSEGKVQLLPGQGGAVETPAEKNFTRLDQLQQALSAATTAGDPTAITEAKRKLDTFSALATPPSESITFDPKTGALTVTKGKQLGDLTTAASTQLQEGVQSAVANIDIANRLEPLISAETVGPRAFAEHIIKDKVLANFFPELASQKRADAITLAARLRASTVQQLKSDGNISEKERAQILQAVPEMNAPLDSPAAARNLIDASRRTAAIGAVLSTTRLKQPIPRAAALVLSTTELKRLVDTGILTKEQALATFDAK